MQSQIQNTGSRFALLTLVVVSLTTGSAFGQFTQHAAFSAGYDGTVVWGDYDNDQDLDFLVIGSSGATQIFINSAGDFTASATGILNLGRRSSAAWGDYDNDGDLDLVVAGAEYTGGQFVPRALVYRNDAGTFSDIAAGLPGVQYSSAAWGDFDNDGDLDILISGDTGAEYNTRVYENDSGIFTDIAAGLEGVRYGSVSWGDFDNDQDLDILVNGGDASGRISRVYENDAGVFTDIGAGLVGLYLGFTAWGDYDSDGDLDALMGGSDVGYGVRTVLYDNNSGSFGDTDGLMAPIRYGDGDWGDYDNDGDLDILISGESYDYNRISQVLVKGTSIHWSGIGANLVGLDLASVDWGDFDNDGDLDILMSGRQSSVSYFAIVYANDGTVFNTPPSAPTNLSVTVDGNLATFSWDAATDAETPAAGLTYNLVVGTTLGGEEICSPMADVDTGYRLIPAMGNVNHNLSWQLELPSQTPFFWGVQAIDGAYAGSPFGVSAWVDPPVILEVTPTPNMLDVPANTVLTVAFDRRIAEDTLNNDTIVVNGSASGLHPGHFIIGGSVHATTVTINPSIDFVAGEVVTVALTTDITSTIGAPLAESFVWSFTVGATDGLGTFDSAVSYFLNANPDDVFAADLDGDRDLDLVTANGPSNQVITLMNDGSGVFAIDAELGVGRQPQAVIAADLDADGDLDLVMAKNYGDDLETWLNNGSGVFTYSMEWTVVDDPHAIAAADLDGDGDMDLVAASSTGAKVSVVLNNGNATFGTPTTYPVGTLPYWIATSDLDGDGDLDLAVANNISDSISVLRNNGDGSFAPSTNYPVGDGPARIAAADLDGDGQVDLVTTNYYSDDVSVLLNLGNGVFDSPTSYPVPEPFGLSCADLNGDGSLDLSVTRFGSNTVYFLTNDGDGTFSYNGLAFVGNGPKAIVAADFDADGDLDLATADFSVSRVSILINQNSFMVGSIWPVPNTVSAPISSNISVQFSTEIDEATVNGSSFVVNAMSSGQHLGTIGFAKETSSATFDPTDDFDSGEVVTIVLTGDIQAASGAFLTGSTWSFTTATEESDGTFSDLQSFPAQERPNALCASDLDGDGDNDLAVVNYNSDSLSVLDNEGDGSFAAQVVYAVEDRPHSVISADLDRDGHLDLVVANYGSHTVSVLPNDGSGNFPASSTSAVGDGPESVFAADFDCDGDLDLATANLISDNISVLMNNGDATFADHVVYPGADNPIYIFGADLDGDGDCDLVTANFLSDDLSVFLNDGDGGFATRTDYPAGDTPNSVYPADLDGDGDLDLVAALATDAQVAILMNNGDATFASPITYAGGVGTYAAVAADVDGDEDLDLVHANVNSNTISIRLNAGDGTFGSRTDYASGNFPNALVAVDLDQDGDLDVATANRYSDDVTVFLNLSPVGVPDSEGTPAVTRLLPNYPNPFNPRTTLIFDLAKPTQRAHLAIYNLKGSLVRTLVNESMGAGRYQVVWTGRNERGQSVASGVYMARLEAGDATQMCKLILLR